MRIRTYTRPLGHGMLPLLETTQPQDCHCRADTAQYQNHMRAQQQRPRRHSIHRLQYHERNCYQHCSCAAKPFRLALLATRRLPHHPLRAYTILRDRWPGRASNRAQRRVRWRNSKHREGRYGSLESKGGADNPRDEEERRAEGQGRQQPGTGAL